MKDVSHENCIQLYEVIEDKYEDDEDGADDQSEKLYMVMELAKFKEVMSWNENIYRFVPNPRLINIDGKSNGGGGVTSDKLICQKFIVKIIKDCVKGLAYLHTVAGIIHRDIKP